VKTQKVDVRRTHTDRECFPLRLYGQNGMASGFRSGISGRQVVTGRTELNYFIMRNMTITKAEAVRIHETEESLNPTPKSLHK
jgi:hypothetical protein